MKRDYSRSNPLDSEFRLAVLFFIGCARRQHSINDFVTLPVIGKPFEVCVVTP